MADKLDIEETNRIRMSLGMAPLPRQEQNSSGGLNFKKSDHAPATDNDDASTLDTRHAAASSNWQKLQDQQLEKKRREDRRTKLKKDRDAEQRFARLEGRALGEEDGDEIDTRSWLLGAGKRQKRIEKERAKQLERELAERERNAQVQYTEKDLVGARVGHELDDIEEGNDQVLTLKDAAVDAASDEDDELENIQVREKERRKERLELNKKKKAVYDPTDEREGNGVLSKYDEEVQGKQKNHFTLSGSGLSTGNQSLFAGDEVIPGRTKISLDFLDDDKAPISDYQDISELKIKKPRKKKEKNRRRKPTEDDDAFPPPNTNREPPPLESMDLDQGTTNGSLSKKRKNNESFTDDGDLQSHLMKQRQTAMKKRKNMGPEELAREMREEAEDELNQMDFTAPIDEDGLIFDETSRFVDNLQGPNSEPERPSRAPSSPGPGKAMEPGFPQASHLDADNGIGTETVSQKQGSPTTPPPEPEESTPALGEEDNLNVGLGAALNMLTSRGIIKTSASGDLNAQHRERQRFLAEKQRREADAEARARLQRERDRASGKLDRMSTRERDAYAAQQNAMRDQQDSRQAADVFNREYKPNVQLKYVDEFGRNMNAKEAFKHLSHQFHGKGSGKLKTEKMLKKVDEEQKDMRKSLLDAGAEDEGLGRARGIQARKRGQAGVRLQ